MTASTGSASACAQVLCASSPASEEVPLWCTDVSSDAVDVEVDRSSYVLTDALRLESARAVRWRYAWTAINGVSAIGPLVAMPFVRRSLWSSLVAGSISSAISTGFTLFWPLEVEGVRGELAFLHNIGPCDRLQTIQRLTASASNDEIARRAWPWHVVNFGVSAALGAVVAIGLDHPTAGFVSGLSGFVVGETQLFTQPVNLRDVRVSVGIDPRDSGSSLLRPSHFAFLGAALEWPLP